MEDLKNIWHSEKIFMPQNKDQHLISNWNEKMKILHLKQKNINMEIHPLAEFIGSAFFFFLVMEW